MTNKPNGTLYNGSTDDLLKRDWEHKNKVIKGFTAKYDLNKLVYFEIHSTREASKLRERQIKKWKRDWKIQLIESINPHWHDLSDTLYQDGGLVAPWTPACAGEDGEKSE